MMEVANLVGTHLIVLGLVPAYQHRVSLIAVVRQIMDKVGEQYVTTTKMVTHQRIMILVIIMVRVTHMPMTGIGVGLNLFEALDGH